MTHDDPARDPPGELETGWQLDPPSKPPVVGAAVWDHSAVYAVYSGNTLLGTSNLEFPIEPGVRVAGWFHAVRAFDEIAAAVFAIYDYARQTGLPHDLARYIAARDALRLELWRAGVRLVGDIELISTWTHTTRVLHVRSSDRRVWALARV